MWAIHMIYMPGEPWQAAVPLTLQQVSDRDGLVQPSGGMPASVPKILGLTGMHAWLAPHLKAHTTLPPAQAAVVPDGTAVPDHRRRAVRRSKPLEQVLAMLAGLSGLQIRAPPQQSVMAAMFQPVLPPIQGG